MKNEVEKLLESLELVCKLLDDNVVKNATNEQLVEYIELTNKLKAVILSNLE